VRVEKGIFIPVDGGIDLDSEAPGWSSGPKSQSPFFLEADMYGLEAVRFGAAYGTEITKIGDNATIDECWNATGFGPSVEIERGNMSPGYTTITICAHTRGGHYAIVRATNYRASAALDIAVWVSTTT